MFSKSTFLFLATLLSQTTSLTLGTRPQRRSTYPFDQIVAFGDELSDNGNGSYAHGITGSPATVYGFGTWTNGPVAVSYLSDLLGVRLRDFAFGGCCGGGSFGATLDSDYTPSPANSPDVVQQIQNYTTSVHWNIGNALQFIWAGQNDLSKHTDAFWLGDPQNDAFATAFATKTAASVTTLLNAGAQQVLVANLYPKHLAPVTPKFLCGDSDECVSTWGQVIENANAALKTALEPFGTQVIYYDVYSFMTGLLGQAPRLGFSKSLVSICDGAGSASWDDCMVEKNFPQYFWMNFEQPTARVHQMIAQDMKSTIDAHYGF